MASFTIRDLPDWWPKLQEKARADGWPLPRLIVQLLSDYLAGRIAPFKLPHRVVVLPELPKNANGKTQRSQVARLALAP